MTNLLSLNEFTAIRFVAMMLLGREIYLLPLVPLFPPARRFLQKIADWAVAHGRAKVMSDLCPELTPDWEHPLTMMENIFGEIEPWQRTYYRFEKIQRRLPEYAMACKQVVSNYLNHRLYTMLAIRRAVEKKGAKNVRVLGLLPDIALATEAYLGPEIKKILSPLRIPKGPVNLLMTIVLLFRSLAWVMRRSRLSPVPAKNYFFVADYIEDPADVNLYEEIRDSGAILLVVRNENYIKNGMPENVAQYDSCFIGDGVFSVRQALGAIRFILKDGMRLYFVLGGAEVSLYYLFIAMPFRRLVYRSFFNRYRPKIFWARDPYNVEHILRRMELTRVGGSSWCSFHAYPAYACIYPMFRYISFDRLFTISRAFHEKYYRDTWSADMEIVSGSTFRASRDVFSRRVPALERPKDILVLCAIYIRDVAMVDFVRDLAVAFPDRKILLQVKGSYHLKADQKVEGRKFADLCMRDLSNIVFTTENVYELLLQARYVFSDPSTAVMEAIQFGAYSFTIDLAHIQKTTTLRDIPEILVTSVEEAVGKVRAIEDGSWPYPIDTLRRFVNLSGLCFQDRVRKDVGLTVRQPARPVWNFRDNGS